MRKGKDSTDLACARYSAEDSHSPVLISPRYDIHQKSDSIKGIRLDEHCNNCGGGCVQAARSVWSPCGPSDIFDMQHESRDNHEREEDAE